MNHRVPDFDMDDDYSIPTSAGLSRPRKASMPDEEIMELLWQNGQVVTQNQNQRSLKKPSQYKFDSVSAVDQPSTREILPVIEEPSASHQQHHLFMQEDEMASWLHYPLQDSTFDNDFCSDLIYNAPAITNLTSTAAEPPEADVIASARPPMPPARRGEVEPRIQNFALFSRQKTRDEPETICRPSTSKSAVRESTVVDSNDTPRLGPESGILSAGRSTEGGSGANISLCRTLGREAVAGSSSVGAGRKTMACEVTISSSPDGSSASEEPSKKQPPLPEDRKRKGRETEYVECQSEDAEFESANAKKQVRGSTSVKRSRAAEVHNLSERRRRDRINEKMKALQDLIPRCNKSDKASMLDEAIEYLKSLQLQLQMMSMGCSMVPMFPGIQSPMGIGIGMGMQMGMGMNRPMMPFPNVLPGSGLPMADAAAHLGPRFPMPSFHIPPASSRIQATNESDAMINSPGVQNPNQPRPPNFADPYQQFFGLHQMQLAQNQAMAQQSTGNPSTGEGTENHENHESGAG